MFTGLIETTGTVLALKPVQGGATRIIVAAPTLAGRWKQGDSIAVNGVCLTAIDVEDEDDTHPGRFAADLAEETIRRTTLTRLAPGSLVNLELPTPAGSPMGGHVVQGHVDGVGRIARIEPLSTNLDRTDWRLSIAVPRELAAAIVQQGSITVDGISLTVARLHPTALDGSTIVEIAIIPHTYAATNLHSLLTGSEVNLETDVLSRYAARRLEFVDVIPEPAEPPQPTWQDVAPTLAHAEPPPPPPAATDEWLTAEYLIARGY